MLLLLKSVIMYIDLVTYFEKGPSFVFQKLAFVSFINLGDRSNNAKGSELIPGSAFE